MLFNGSNPRPKIKTKKINKSKPSWVNTHQKSTIDPSKHDCFVMFDVLFIDIQVRMGSSRIVTWVTRVFQVPCFNEFYKFWKRS